MASRCGPLAMVLLAIQENVYEALLNTIFKNDRKLESMRPMINNVDIVAKNARKGRGVFG